MPEVEIGVHRLFEAVQCRFNVPDNAQVLVRKELGNGILIHIAVGKQVRVSDFHVRLPNAGLVPVNAHGQGTVTTKHVLPEPDERPTFVEVTASRMVEISQSHYDAVARNTKRGNQRLQSRCVQEQGTLPELATIFAGIVGMRMHKQLVMQPVGEGLFVLRADGRWKYFSFGFMGEAVWDTVLDKDAVREGMRPIEQGMTITDRTVSERALTWLLRGWQERVPLFKFLAFFLALENMTVQFGGKATPPPPTEAREIQALLQQYGGERASVLQRFFAKNVVQPREAKDSLQIRFARLAQQASLPTMQADIAAFAQFREMRDALMHEGNDKVKTAVPVEIDGVGHMVDIEGLAVRYLNWLHFQDQRHYSENEITAVQLESELGVSGPSLL